MRLVTYEKADGSLHAGEWRDGQIYTLSAGQSVLELIQRSAMPERDGQFKLMTKVSLRAPYYPPRIFAVGRNYFEHIAEMGRQVPEKPFIFSKFPSSIIGDHAPIRWRTSITQQVDWEGELGVVIGKGGRDIPEASAYEHVFGYTIANDVSARDLQDNDGQWVRAKGMDTFCPLGPVLVTADEIPDPQALKLQTYVNDQLMQDGTTADMMFSIPTLISYLSRSFTLLAGDLILTGTPSGVGKGQKPPRFLGAGDVVKVSIEGIGTLTNPCHPEA